MLTTPKPLTCDQRQIVRDLIGTCEVTLRLIGWRGGDSGGLLAADWYICELCDAMSKEQEGIAHTSTCPCRLLRRVVDETRRAFGMERGT